MAYNAFLRLLFGARLAYCFEISLMVVLDDANFDQDPACWMAILSDD